MFLRQHKGLLEYFWNKKMDKGRPDPVHEKENKRNDSKLPFI